MLHIPKFRGPGKFARREFLRALIAAPGLVCGFTGIRNALLSGSIQPNLALQAPTSKQELQGLVTANPDFFIRNHFRTPQISADSWSLEVTGLVSNPLKLSYTDLLLANSVKYPSTMECAGNVSGGKGVGTAIWSGMPLMELLKQAAPKNAATTVVFHGADSGDEGVPPNTHFARAIPLEKAMDASTMLAYEMNGSPLPAEHGFPLRALVAGWYGMDSVKWLTRIEVLDRPFEGYFQNTHYRALSGRSEPRIITQMLVNSRFVRPFEGEEIHGKSYHVEGLAWAGEQKIAKVEFRAIPGGNWQTASVRPSPAPMVWTSWSYDWQVPGAGRYAIEARATDDQGRVQPDTRDPGREDAYELNTPHRIAVTVTA